MRSMAATVAAVSILGMLLGPTASMTAGEDPSHNAGESTAAPHERDYHYSLSPEGFASVFGLKADGKLTITLPLLKVFNREGHLVLDLSGYHDDLAKLLRRMIGAPKPVTGGRTLAEVLSEVWTIDRRPPLMSGLSDADFYLVTFEAEWCVPCKAQLKNAQAFAEANPKTRINVVHVDADIAKLDAEMQQRLFSATVQAPKQQ